MICKHCTKIHQGRLAVESTELVSFIKNRKDMAGIIAAESVTLVRVRASAIVLDSWRGSTIICGTPDFSIKSQADQVIQFQRLASPSSAKLD